MVLAHSSDVGLVVWREGGKQITMVSWPSWLRHRANNAGISGSIPLETISFLFLFLERDSSTYFFWEH